MKLGSRHDFLSVLTSPLWRRSRKVTHLPQSGPPAVPDTSGAERWCFISWTYGPWAATGLLFLSQAEGEPGTAGYLFSHFPRSALEPDRPRRLPLAGFAAKAFKLFIFVGVSRDTFRTQISTPNDFTNNSMLFFLIFETT